MGNEHERKVRRTSSIAGAGELVVPLSRGVFLDGFEEHTLVLGLQLGGEDWFDGARGCGRGFVGDGSGGRAVELSVEVGSYREVQRSFNINGKARAVTMGREETAERYSRAANEGKRKRGLGALSAVSSASDAAKQADILVVEIRA